jgi:solute carrier family 13 (sodium-dependent dicarboxylate transporter), member 2/3/5
MLQRTTFFLAPIIFFVCCFTNFGLERPAQITLGITIWMALWWIIEPVPIAVTSLLPLILFPVTGVLPLKITAAEYGNEIVYLFLAGFILGKAIEKWQLHRRIALTMVFAIGTNPKQIVLGFMVATAFISMWISNTATAIMMLPVALAVAGRPGVVPGNVVSDASNQTESRGASSNFSKNLMLGIGYAASIGGMATIIGTPTNAIFISFMKQNYPEQTVSFGKWLAFGLPFAAILLMFCWWMLLRVFPMKSGENEQNSSIIGQELANLGKISTSEKRVLWLFGLVIFGWVSGSLVWYKWFDKPLGVGDTVVALVGAIGLFLIPAKGISGEKLMDWKTAEKLPWGILLLFGGGLALAKGFDVSGLAKWLGNLMIGLQSLPMAVILLLIFALIVLLSEVASNIATASMMMPVLNSLALALGIAPFGLLMTATLAASVGFMLPIATAPNTIVFSSGHLTTRDMMRAGFWLDLAAILLLIVFIFSVMPLVWGIHLAG